MALHKFGNFSGHLDTQYYRKALYVSFSAVTLSFLIKPIFSSLQLQRARSSSFCVVADDSLLLTVLTASYSKFSDVVSIFPGLQEKGAKYLEAVADANGFSMDRIKVFGKRAPCLLTDDSNKRKV